MRLPSPTRRVSLAQLRAGLAAGTVTRAAVVPGTPACQLGERPVWVGEDLVWVDIDAGMIHRMVRPRHGVAQVQSLAVGSAVSLALPWPGEAGTLLAATAAGLVVVEPAAWAPPAGTCAPDQVPDAVAQQSEHTGVLHARGLRDVPGGRPAGMEHRCGSLGERFNDGAVDAAGRLWVSSVSGQPGAAAGSLWVAGPVTGGPAAWSWTVAVQGVACGNGIAWSPDGATMYLAESISRAIYAFTVKPDGRAVKDPRVVVALSHDGPMPDGLVVDAAGLLWVALWDGSCVVCLDPADPWRAVAAIDLPTPRVTALALPVHAGDPVYVTTAAGPACGGMLFAAERPSPARPDAIRCATEIDLAWRT